MKLANDICRCLDQKCGVRFTCARFQQGGDRIPMTETMKDPDEDDDLPCDSYIEDGFSIEIDDPIIIKDILDE